MTRPQAVAGLLGLLVGCGGLLVGIEGHPAAPARYAWAAPAVHLVAPAGAVATAMPAPLRTVLPPVVPAGDRPRVAAPTADHRLLAPPSISAAGMDRVLAQYGSPAAGQGALFYDLGVQYGIDPAYALAFYIVESHAGTRGVARFTHGIGNIRVTPGYASYEGYRAYDTYAAGIEDWYMLIRELYIQSWGLTTPRPILARYAPWGDGNNPNVYAATVKALVDGWQP